MVSTVTTTTVSTVTTVTIAGSLALMGILLLLALLIQKELATSTESSLARVFGRVLNASIVPLLMGFVLIVCVKVAQIFQ